MNFLESYGNLLPFAIAIVVVSAGMTYGHYRDKRIEKKNGPILYEQALKLKRMFQEADFVEEDYGLEKIQKQNPHIKNLYDVFFKDWYLDYF